MKDLQTHRGEDFALGNDESASLQATALKIYRNSVGSVISKNTTYSWARQRRSSMSWRRTKNEKMSARCPATRLGAVAASVT
jgi:hypothetical protein